MEDLEKFKKFAFPVFVPLCFDVFAIQSDFFAQSIAMALYSFVMGSLLQFLCMK